MTPTEAIDLGFATEQIANKASLAAFSPSRFRNAPKWLAEMQQPESMPWRTKLARRRLALLTIASQ
jgi:hypothetical protein